MQINIGDIFIPTNKTPMITGCLPASIEVYDAPVRNPYIPGLEPIDSQTHCLYVYKKMFLGDGYAVMGINELNNFINEYRYKKVEDKDWFKYTNRQIVINSGIK